MILVQNTINNDRERTGKVRFQQTRKGSFPRRFNFLRKMQKYFHAEIESHSHSTMGGSHCEPEEFARNTRRQSGLIGKALVRQAKDASLLEYFLLVKYFYSPLSPRITIIYHVPSLYFDGCLMVETSGLTWDGRNQDIPPPLWRHCRAALRFHLL